MAFVAAAAPVLGLLGAGVSAAGAIEGGIAQKNSYAYQAQVAKNNEAIANQNAVYAAQAGSTQATQKSLQGAEKQARIKGALAANGVDINSGSAVDVQQSAREESKLDTELTAANASAQAYGYRVQQQGFEEQSSLDTAASENAVPGAILGATGGLLSNASAIGMKPNAFNNLNSFFSTS
jgi:hypothetical protein